jgi:hypothetical protein
MTFSLQLKLAADGDAADKDVLCVTGLTLRYEADSVRDLAFSWRHCVGAGVALAELGAAAFRNIPCLQPVRAAADLLRLCAAL